MIDKNVVSTSPSKVENVTHMTSTDLMEPDGVTPSQKQDNTINSMIAKPLFNLSKGEKRKGKQHKNKQSSRRLCASDWILKLEQAFENLKPSLVHSVILAHPDFSRPFMLSTDASLDGIGAVLSQIQVGET